MSKLESSHGKQRVTPDRLSDLGDRPAPEQLQQRREQLRENARYRASKEASRANLRAIVGDQVRGALPSATAPEESRLVAEQALTMASDAAREVAVASPFVAHHVTRFGVNSALAGFYTQKAAEVGFGSPEGIALVEAAHRAETAATRAMTAAMASAKEVAGKRRDKSLDATPWLVADTKESK